VLADFSAGTPPKHPEMGRKSDGNFGRICSTDPYPHITGEFTYQTTKRKSIVKDNSSWYDGLCNFVHTLF